MSFPLPLVGEGLRERVTAVKLLPSLALSPAPSPASRRGEKVKN